MNITEKQTIKRQLAALIEQDDPSFWRWLRGVTSVFHEDMLADMARDQEYNNVIAFPKRNAS